MPDGWRLHPVFHSSYLKPAVGYGYCGDSVPDSGFCPPVDDVGKFEVERVLDHYSVHRGCVWVDEYLVKLVGYGLFEATWEPSAHLANDPTALANFLATWGGPRMGTRVSRGGGGRGDVRI